MKKDTVSCPLCHFDNPPETFFCGKCGTKLGLKETPQYSKTMTMMAPAPEFERGKIFAGRYEIIEELGAGGMGIVYHAYDRQIGEGIALKVLHPDVALDERTVDRFRNEIKLARWITHKNVCRMHELHQDGKQLFITMEYVPGQNLKRLIKETGALATGKAISIAKQVCEGLAEAHDLGVTHRDLKPQNIMVDKEGNAKIMDFGIARSLRTAGMTAEGMIIGTPEYMAPEQVEGQEADQRTDIYALGAILFEMVTGRVPFEGDAPLSVAYKHKNEIPIPPRKLNAQVSEPLNGLILRCLEKEKENRYQTADEVLVDLVRIEEGLPIFERVILKARPTIHITREKPTGLKRFLVPALVFLGLMIAAGLVWRFVLQKGGVAEIENSIAVIGFENQTGDPANDMFRKAIPSLLITNLENTHFFNYVATWEQLQDLVKQSGKKDVQFIDGEAGFTACRRAGIKAVITGSFIKAGDTFVTDVKVLDAQTKKLLKSANSRGTGQASILDSQVDELTRKIAEGMGISQQKAESYQTKIADATTKSPAALSFYLRGRDECERFLYADARRSLERAVELDPTFAVAYLYLSGTYAGLSDPKAQDQALEKARQFSGKAAEKERLYIESAYADRIERNPDKHYRILRELTGKYPSEKYAQYQLALYYGGRHLYSEAVAAYEKALVLDPNYGPALNGLAFVYADMGDLGRAIQYLERYAAVNPNDPNPRDSIAELYVRLGKLEEAIATYKGVLAAHPDFYFSWGSLAAVYALQENYPEVDRCLDGFLAQAPVPSAKLQARWLKAYFDYLRGRWDRALTEYVSIIDEVDKGAPRYAWPAYWVTAYIYRDKGEWELAQRMFDTFFDMRTKINPASLTYLTAMRSFFRGWLDLKRERIDDARAALREIEPLLRGADAAHKEQMSFFKSLLVAEVALTGDTVEEAVAAGLQIVPRNYSGSGTGAVAEYNLPFLKDVLARAYWKKGDLARAAAEYRRLMTIDPANQVRYLIHPLYHYRLGRVLEEKGDREKARVEYGKFLEYWKDADPGHPELADAKKRLGMLP